MKTRAWKNDQPGRWTARIEWYEMAKGIKLRLQDNGNEKFLYPKTEDEAERIWELFKRYAKPNGVATSDFLDEMIATMEAIDG